MQAQAASYCRAGENISHRTASDTQANDATLSCHKETIALAHTRETTAQEPQIPLTNPTPSQKEREI